MGVYIFQTLDVFIDIVHKIDNNEEGCMYRNHNGPTYILFELERTDCIHLAHCLTLNAAENPSEYPLLVSSGYVDKISYGREVAKFSRELYDEIVITNKNASENQKMKKVLEKTEDLEKILNK